VEVQAQFTLRFSSTHVHCTAMAIRDQKSGDFATISNDLEDHPLQGDYSHKDFPAARQVITLVLLSMQMKQVQEWKRGMK
jgi:hypothetical protein